MQYNNRQTKPAKAKRPSICVCCQDNINYVDYKKVDVLRKFVSGTFKIVGSDRSGLCNKHQRLVGNAVKLARTMALMPYTKGQTRKKMGA